MKILLTIQILLFYTIFANGQNWIKNGDFENNIDTVKCVYNSSNFYQLDAVSYYNKNYKISSFNNVINTHCFGMSDSQKINHFAYFENSSFSGSINSAQKLLLYYFSFKLKKVIKRGIKFTIGYKIRQDYYSKRYYNCNDTQLIYNPFIFPSAILTDSLPHKNGKYSNKFPKIWLKYSNFDTINKFFYLSYPETEIIRPNLVNKKDKWVYWSQFQYAKQDINYLTIGNFLNTDKQINDYIKIINGYCEPRLYFLLDDIFIKPVLHLGNDTTICPNQTFTIRTLLGDSENLVWNDGSKADSLVIHQPGKYWVTWTHEDGISTDTIIVGDKSQNLAPFPELPNQKTICSGQSYFYPIPDTNQFKTYLGKFLQTEAINLTQSGFYKITLKNQCEIVKDYPFTLTDSLCDLFIDIPNAITPNEDGLNDVFSPIIRSNLNYHYKLSIFDRWGQSLFTGQNQGWNSLDSNGKTYPMDAYLYLIEVYIQDDPSPKVVKTGTVTILK